MLFLRKILGFSVGTIPVPVLSGSFVYKTAGVCGFCYILKAYRLFYYGIMYRLVPALRERECFCRSSKLINPSLYYYLAFFQSAWISAFSFLVK